MANQQPRPKGAEGPRIYVREAVMTISRTAAVREHKALQEEMFDLRTFTSKLLMSLTNVLLGEPREQREGIDGLLDLIDADPRIARRMVAILEANPNFREKAPQLWERAQRALSSGLLSGVARHA